MFRRGIWGVVWLLVFCVSAIGAPKEKLVLLPLQGKGLSAEEQRLYQGAIKSELSVMYTIYSGEEVEAKLKKIAITSCTSDECLEQIAIAFNGHLVGRGYVTDSKGTPLLGLEIRDIFTHQDVFSESAGCEGCNGSGIIRMFKAMAAGRAASGAGAVAYVSQAGASGPASGGVVRVSPAVSGNTGSPIAALFFDTEPSGATVSLGDTVAGTTPYQNLSLKPGQTIRVTVRKEGYHDQQVELPLSGGINELGTLKLKSKYGRLSIESDPSGADVIIAGKKVGVTPYADEKILSGAYLVSLRKALYLPVENRRVVVEEEKQTAESYVLEANYGTLAVDSAPAGASFALKSTTGESVQSGTTPSTIQATPGVYTLAVSKEGHASLKFDVTLARDKTVAIDKAQATLRKLQGEAIVSSEPYVKGAKVLVDGREAGVLPLSLILAAGPHEITVETGTKAGKSRVTVTDGGSAVVKVVLKDAKSKPFTNSLDMAFVWIKPGTFIMGSPSGEVGRVIDENQHEVTLTRGFYMQTTEVTQGQWKKVMGDNPSWFKNGGDNCPVENVSWKDAQKFIQKLNKMEGSKGYRLPTEAQWEYTCRAGSSGPFAFGGCLSTDQANYQGSNPLFGCSTGRDRQTTVPVASFAPNAWGLYDMHGNVSEWCQDWRGNYPSGAVTDPVGPSSGEHRALRGGSCFSGGRFCRSALRNGFRPGIRSGYLGFRLAIGLE